MTQPEYTALKTELLEALDTHIDILKDASYIQPDHLDGIMFMMRSFGFMLDRAPKVLSCDDPDEMNYLMFQYYSLLTELKYNLTLNFPYAKINNKSLLEIVDAFPTTYEKEMKNWWEATTGLKVEETKQTIEIKSFEY
ncbi:hypothetical protein JZO76_07085 [Enterococcus sp. MJM12]|uniref:Uncharacterized protein n=1 Tax=Candidatus Enterococcus myersii TaxID=2815322 RepID=A0ABS3H808_9ENTE|nr:MULTISPECIES: hypothetical protein [Enterococcus]MBO0449303.1 hypothetical protein [Enterococcus sp. MJM12]MCD1025227.1 hypothetical protein [Enterococcus sp. SMC-9]MDT2739021.1 hypothetical protein [Enterococcus canintestini]WHA09598.1 hypothetical protein P3T75_01775 [Enterococcus montenegrensis]